MLKGYFLIVITIIAAFLLGTILFSIDKIQTPEIALGQTINKLYHNSVGNFSTYIPNNWLNTTNSSYSDDDPTIVTFNSPDKRYFVEINLDKGVADSLSSVINDTISGYKSGTDSYDGFNLTNTTSSIGTLNKVNTISITYSYYDENKKLKDVETFFFHGNNLFSIRYEETEDQFKNGLPVYNEIVSSFLFK